MLFSLNSSIASSATKAFNNSATSLFFHPQKNHFSPLLKPSLSIKRPSSSNSISTVDTTEPISSRRTNFSGLTLNDSVETDSKKLRLDAWISSRINGISRARVQSSIKSGLVSVNGRKIEKASHMVRNGDKVNCTISEMQPLKAEAEDIPLDIVYEDNHLLVVNKPAHMVVHPAPGNANGTLVNGILHHCSLPLTNQNKLFDEDEEEEEEDYNANIRPGIVHRLDKGTSGLLVVAKDEQAHANLAEQFKEHTIKRVYVSLTCGVPSPCVGRVNVPIGRDSNNRIRMIAGPGSNTRYAASRYKVVEILANGGSALVEWRLETGRTHQIRAHAKYLGVPLMGDEVYGGTKSMALSLLYPKTPVSFHGKLVELLAKIERPCLHALTLGFEHPHTGENVNFSRLPPEDFAEVLSQLREISTEKLS